jgi:MFS transporter, ACS family, hexuronate transporter
MPSILLVMHAPVQLVIVLFSIAFAGQQSWSTLIMTLPSDIVPTSVVGSVAGMVGFGGATGGIVFGLVVGQLLDHGFSYGPVFACVGVLHVIGFFVILASNRVIGPICFKTRLTHSATVLSS